MAKILSTEDKDLQNSALTTSRSRVYSDIDLSFAVNTSTGDIFKKKDAAAVKQSVKNILQTNRFEKPFKPDLVLILEVFCLNWQTMILRTI